MAKRKMTRGSGGLTLITPGQGGVGPAAREIPWDRFEREFAELLQRLTNSLRQGPATNGWKPDGLTVSVGFTLQGTLGIVTAGVQASIQVAFKPR